MILIDMNQVMISNLMMQISVRDGELEEGLVRHMVLTSLRMYRRKFGEKYGELVLCYDSKNYWRKKVFPFYKASRKKDREKSNHNWHRIFDVLNKLRDEFQKNLPYKVMCIDGTEADDIIAVLTKDQGTRNIRLQKDMQPPVPVLILSGDKDFVQLQKYPYVKQYNPVKKAFVECVDPLCIHFLFQSVTERVGFEPTDACTSLVFKTSAINHSTTSPTESIIKERG
jgi:5'-3' exonuclease